MIAYFIYNIINNLFEKRAWWVVLDESEFYSLVLNRIKKSTKYCIILKLINNSIYLCDISSNISNTN